METGLYAQRGARETGPLLADRLLPLRLGVNQVYHAGELAYRVDELQ